MVYLLKDVKVALGTFVTITVTHPKVDVGAYAIGLAFAEIDRVQKLMSVYNNKSDINCLNRNGYLAGLSNDTRYVIHKSTYYSKLCDGAFDITVLPVIELWEDSFKRKAVPSEKELAERLKLVDYRKLIIEENQVRFTQEGMKVTLAGAAKGYAVDKAIEVLAECGIENALVNAGGDIRCIGGKTDTTPWKVAIRDPLNKTQIRTVLELRDRAIATSGSYQRPYNDIIDPRTGRPVDQDIVSASILADKAIDADILTKCLYIPGIIRCRELLQGLIGIEGIAITKNGSIIKLP